MQYPEQPSPIELQFLQFAFAPHWPQHAEVYSYAERLGIERDRAWQLIEETCDRVQQRLAVEMN